MEKIKKNKFVELAVILLMTLLFFMYGKTKLNDGFYGFRKLYLIISIALIILCLVNFYGTEIKKISIVKLYLINGIILGLIINFLIPVFAVPDEPVHLATAYNISNEMLGKEIAYDGIYMRKCDADLQLESLEIKEEYLDEYISYFHETTGDTEMVKTGYTQITTPRFQYIVSACGITLGRLLGLNAIWTMELGRFFNYIMFVVLVALSIKIIPYGKSIIFAVAMIPTMLQQSFSYNYDCIINAIAIFTVALMLKLRSEEKKKIIYIILMIVSIFAMVVVKNYAYLAFLLLLFVAFDKEVKNSFIKLKEKLKNNKIMALIIGAILLAVCVVVVYFVINKIMLIKKEPVTQVLSYCEEDGYTLSYALNYPIDTIILYFRTLFEKSTFYMMSLFGGHMGWLNLSISYFAMLPIIIMVLLLSCNEGNEAGLIKKKDKFVFAMVCIISVLFICTGMFYSWTPISSFAIEGVQGRYFLPIMPMFLFLIYSSKGIIVTSSLKEKIYRFIPVIYAFYLVNLMMIY